MANKDWYEAARNCICNSGSPLVRIDRNKNTSIENVNITVGLYPVASSCSNMKGHRERLKEMITEDILINTVTKKQVYLIDVLERFRYIVYKEQNIVMLDTIMPTDILLEGHVAELSTYKGVMISKANADKEKFMINLFSAMDDK